MTVLLLTRGVSISRALMNDSWQTMRGHFVGGNVSKRLEAFESVTDCRDGCYRCQSGQMTVFG